MKATVSLDYNEQKKRQESTMDIMLGMLPPSQMRLAIMIILGVTLTLAGVGIILCGVLPEKLNTYVLILGIIVTICGIATTVSITVAAISKTRKSKSMRTQLDEAFEDFFSRLPNVTDMAFETVGGSIKITYLAGEVTLHSFTQKLHKVAALVFDDKLAADFTDRDFYCFSTSDLGEEGFEELRKILMETHESYQVIEKDEKGKYRLLGDEKGKS